MFLSLLEVDTRDTPSNPRPGRLWLRNLYHVHQRLCMAFPSNSRKEADPEFLQPYNPKDFGSGHVHVPREPDSGFLFRIDPHPGGRAVISVQSALEPDWDYAFHNACYFLSAPPEVKSLGFDFQKGQKLKFRLLANPVRKIDTLMKEERKALSNETRLECTCGYVFVKHPGGATPPHADDCPVRSYNRQQRDEEYKKKKGRHGKRVPVPFDNLYEWLGCKAESGGFALLSDQESTLIQTGYVYFNKPAGSKKGENGKRLFSARFDGVLQVAEPDKFNLSIAGGIGSGKAFGFGLLSVAPARD